MIGVFRLESQRENYEASSDKQMNYMWEQYGLLAATGTM